MTKRMGAAILGNALAALLKHAANSKHHGGKGKSLLVETVLLKYDEGIPIRTSADELGISENTLYRHIVEMCPEEWRAVISRALMRKEAAEERLNDAKDGLELSKAEKQLKSAQWDLERVFQRMYAQKQDAEHGGTKAAMRR
jgi:hypothetical protein